MQKIWQWIRDRKTNTIRKWRSTLVPRSSESMESSEKLGKRVGKTSVVLVTYSFVRFLLRYFRYYR